MVLRGEAQKNTALKPKNLKFDPKSKKYLKNSKEIRKDIALIGALTVKLGPPLPYTQIPT